MFGVCFSEAVRAGLRPSLDESGELSAMPPLSESHSVLLPCCAYGMDADSAPFGACAGYNFG